MHLCLHSRSLTVPVISYMDRHSYVYMYVYMCICTLYCTCTVHVIVNMHTGICTCIDCTSNCVCAPSSALQPGLPACLPACLPVSACLSVCLSVCLSLSITCAHVMGNSVQRCMCNYVCVSSPLSVLPSPPASPRDWQDLICPTPAEQPGQPGLQPAGLPAPHSEPPHHLPTLPASVPERAVSGEGEAVCVCLSVCLSVCIDCGRLTTTTAGTGQSQSGTSCG